MNRDYTEVFLLTLLVVMFYDSFSLSEDDYPMSRSIIHFVLYNSDSAELINIEQGMMLGGSIIISNDVCDRIHYNYWYDHQWQHEDDIYSMLRSEMLRNGTHNDGSA